MPYPLSPSNTESAGLYSIGQFSIEGSIVEIENDELGNTYHKWGRAGENSALPAVIDSLTSTDATAPLSANQGSVLSGANIASMAIVNGAIVTTLKNGTTLAPVPLPISVLDGNDKPVLRTNSTANVAPTALEVPTPINGDTATVILLDKSIEFWSYNGTVWAKTTTLAYVTGAAYDAVYGTIGTTSAAGTVNAVANWGYLGDGTPLLTDRVYFASTAANLNKTVTVANLKTLLAAPDDIVDVSGVTFPIGFPVATLPGAPVFAPATPTSATAVYKIVTGTNVVYAAWNGTQYISAPAPIPTVLDGNDKHVVRANSSNAVVPSATEVPSPIAGDTAKVFLSNKSIELWGYNGTAWALDHTYTPLALDGNDKHVVRTNATPSIAPTATEVPTPIAGDTAKVSLTDGSIEYWTFTTAWARDFVSVPAVGNVRYGTAAPVVVTGTDKKNDTYIQNSTGTVAGVFIAEWVFDGTAWYKVTPVIIDDIVDVSGVTFPIAFPAATLPGTPVFAPATPTLATAVYKIVTGADVAYAVWNGTQYVSTPAPAIITASNGVTKTGNDIRLGGVITAPVVLGLVGGSIGITGLAANATPIDVVTRNATGVLTQSPLTVFTGNVRYGTVAPVVVAGTDKKNDTYIQNSTGTAAGVFIAEWVFDGTAWYSVTPVIVDDIVDVSGVTFPIAFPVATLPGTPVFSPATPISTTAVYKIVTGTNVAYAAWNGTQYVSAPAPAIAADFFSSVTATANTPGLPDGAIDLTQNIRREGFIGVQNDPTSTFHGRTLALNGVNSSVTTQAANDFARIIVTSTTFSLLDPNLYPGRIIQLVNSNAVPLTLTGTNFYINHLVSSAATQNSIPAKACVTLQSISNSTLIPNGQYWQLIDIGTMPALTADDVVDVSGVTFPIAFPIATLPGTPVFTPATPTSTTAVYKIVTGSNVAYAAWNGTQYISAPAPALPADFFSSVVATANTQGLPNGATDLTEAIRREGFTGFGVNPTSQLHTTSLATAAIETAAAAYATTAADHTIRLITIAAQTVTFHVPASVPGQILEIANASPVAKTLSGYLNFDGTLVTSIPARSTVVIQSIGGSWKAIEQIVAAPLSFFPTNGYSVPSGVSVNRVNDNIGTVVGADYQIPNTVERWQAFDGNFTTNIILPATNNTTGRFSVYNGASFSQVVRLANTDLPQDAVITTGNSMHFEYSNGLWRWVYAPEEPERTRYTVTDIFNGVVVGGNVPSPAQVFSISDGTGFANPIVLPPVTNASEMLTITSAAGLESTIATTNRIAGSVALPINLNQSITFVPTFGGWTELNVARINGAARTTTRGTYAAPLTGAVSFGASDYRLIVANGSTTTLPSPIANPGRTIEIKKAGATGTAAFTGLVDGAVSATYSIANLNENVTLYSDGATWIRS